MGTTTFDQFVQRETKLAEAESGKSVNWEEERDFWLRELDFLYSTVEAYLDTYVQAGQVQLTYRLIQLNEENIGVYAAREMSIVIGAKTIRLEPIGTLLIGTKGRVDVIGPIARATLMLINEHVRAASDMVSLSISTTGRTLSPPRSANPGPADIHWVWKIVRRPPQPSFVPLAREVFFDLLLEIANG